MHWKYGATYLLNRSSGSYFPASAALAFSILKLTLPKNLVQWPPCKRGRNWRKGGFPSLNTVRFRQQSTCRAVSDGAVKLVRRVKLWDHKWYEEFSVTGTYPPPFHLYHCGFNKGATQRSGRTNEKNPLELLHWRWSLSHTYVKCKLCSDGQRSRFKKPTGPH